MPDFHLVYSAVKGEWAEAMRQKYLPVATAATRAIEDVALQVKTRGRSAIAAAGFSRRWQNALRVNVYPERGRVSVDAAAFIYHKIPYAGVFEDGARISGSPFLWIPFSNVQQRIGGKRLTPRLFIATVGPLHSVNVPGKPPMLAAYVSANFGGGKKITLASLRAGMRRRSKSGAGSVRSVPIFFGINAVQLRARFGLQAIFNSGRASLAQAYLNHMKTGR
jgi:hypothetical protein